MTWPTKTDFVDGDVLTAAQVNNIGNNLNEADPTGITDGYVLTADGSGGMGWEAPAAAGSLTLLSTTDLAGLSSVTVSSISQDYTNLYVYCKNMYAGATSQRMQVYPTSMNTVSYQGSYVIETAATTVVNTANTNSTYGLTGVNTYSGIAAAGAGYYTNFEFWISDYTTTTSGSDIPFKFHTAGRIDSVANRFDGWITGFIRAGANGAVDDLNFVLNGGSTWTAGTVYIYGVN